MFGRYHTWESTSMNVTPDQLQCCKLLIGVQNMLVKIFLPMNVFVRFVSSSPVVFFIISVPNALLYL